MTSLSTPLIPCCQLLTWRHPGVPAISFTANLSWSDWRTTWSPLSTSPLRCCPSLLQPSLACSWSEERGTRLVPKSAILGVPSASRRMFAGLNCKHLQDALGMRLDIAMESLWRTGHHVCQTFGSTSIWTAIHRGLNCSVKLGALAKGDLQTLLPGKGCLLQSQSTRSFAAPGLELVHFASAQRVEGLLHAASKPRN